MRVFRRSDLRREPACLHQSTVSCGGQPDLVDVEAGLDLPQDADVDAVVVAEADDGGAFVGEESEAQGGVLLSAAHRLSVVRLAFSGAGGLEVGLVLAADPLGDLGVGTEAGDDAWKRLVRRRGGGAPGQEAFFVHRGVTGQPGPAHHGGQQQSLGKEGDDDDAGGDEDDGVAVGEGCRNRA
ncbi:hypothetical protein [Streptomyces sp. NPDC050263]|uniref:hypothetical protein n=1 Tax=Streptomyces sp. NPDC050263 TaxID=3155037 RepID=UPI00342E0766